MYWCVDAIMCLGHEPRNAVHLIWQRSRVSYAQRGFTHRDDQSLILRPVILSHGDRDLVGLVACDTRGGLFDLTL